MRLLNSRRSCRFLEPALLAGVWLLCGCATPKDLFTASGPGWKIQTGQALWQPEGKRPQIAGDLLLAGNGAGSYLIQFDKSPISLASAQVTSNHWLIRFPQVQRSFSGRGPGPTRFIVLYLPRALAGEPLPEPVHFERKPGGGWRLDNPSTGESIEGFLSP